MFRVLKHQFILIWPLISIFYWISYDVSRNVIYKAIMYLSKVFICYAQAIHDVAPWYAILVKHDPIVVSTHRTSTRIIYVWIYVYVRADALWTLCLQCTAIYCIHCIPTISIWITNRCLCGYWDIIFHGNNCMCLC